jgi:hypothetical protein
MPAVHKALAIKINLQNSKGKSFLFPYLCTPSKQAKGNTGNTLETEKKELKNS